MLPSFDEYGYLPPGIHQCDVDELVARFGSGSPEREVETQELLDFLAWTRRADIRRVIVNGSYVTVKAAPNDVDIVVLPGADYPHGEPALDQQEARWPFLHIFIAVDEVDVEKWCLRDFGIDRHRQAKGVVELLP